LIGASRAGVFVNLVPVFASIMAVIFLQEVFQMYHALALILVLGGIWLSEIGKAR
jgi:drug/metabolite transporter (DMT)-like permease